MCDEELIEEKIAVMAAGRVIYYLPQIWFARYLKSKGLSYIVYADVKPYSTFHRKYRNISMQLQ